MLARRAVLLLPPKSSHSPQLPSSQHVAPISPLGATLTQPPSKCCSQKTYAIPNSFRCNTYKKHRMEGQLWLTSSSFLITSRPKLQRNLGPHIPTLSERSNLQIGASPQLRSADPDLVGTFNLQTVFQLSPILRTLFQVPYPLSPVFATLTKTAGVWGHSSHFRNWALLLCALGVSAFNSSSCFDLQLRIEDPERLGTVDCRPLAKPPLRASALSASLRYLL